MKRILIGVLVLGLLALFGWRLAVKISAGGEQKERGTNPIAVRTAPVQSRTLRDVRSFTGSLRAANTFVMAPKVWGRLEMVKVKLGDPVENGQVVARIEDAEYKLQVEQAQAELDVANARIEQCKAQLTHAENEYKRALELREKNISSQSDLERVQSNFNTYQTELKVLTAQAQEKAAALRGAEVRLGYTTMHAKWDEGDAVRYVGRRFVDEGEMLAPNKPVLSIVDIGQLEAVVHVIERDYPLLLAGQKTEVFTDAYPDTVFGGTVVRISQVLSEESRQAEMNVKVPNAELKLKPGMFVRVEVELARHENAVAVPRAALVKHNNKDGVWQVDPDSKTAVFVPVEVGLLNADWAEITSPALNGDVITLGHHLLREGSPVILPTTTPTAEK